MTHVTNFTLQLAIVTENQTVATLMRISTSRSATADTASNAPMTLSERTVNAVGTTIFVSVTMTDVSPATATHLVRNACHCVCGGPIL